MEAAGARDAVARGRAVPLGGFVGAVVALAVLLAARPLGELPGRLPDLPAAFWVMAGLAMVSDSRPFTPPGRRQTSTVFPSICFTFAILLAWGFGAAVAVQAAAVAVSSFRMRHRPSRAVFNLGQYALALAAAGAVITLAGPVRLAPSAEPRWPDVVVAATAGLVWFTVKYGTVTVALHLRFGGPWRPRLRRGLAFDLLSTGSLLLLSPVLLAAAEITPALIPLILVPLYAVYRMARLSTEQDELARTDPLTGLASRKAMVDRVAQEAAAHVDRAARGATDARMALLLLDLDRFQHVNDALGHAVGDRLLVEVGERIRDAVGPGDTVARLGGDEFAVLATRLRGEAAARELAARLTAALSAPVVLDGLPVDVGGSIGIALHPEHGADFAALLRHADVAMYDAKHGSAGVAVYTAESDQHSAARLALLADLRHALAGPGDGGLAMHYQPQVDIVTGEVVGVEALLRWRHPRHGAVDPGELMKVAEHTPVMSVLTRWVVDGVIDQVARWRATGLQLRASLNVSVRDLHTGDLVDRIVERLGRHGLPPSQVQLEITESALMADPARVLDTISRLARVGVAIALDDFGTGYSSLQHLRRLPLTEVKIDRSFVVGMADDPDDAAIVRSIIELAGALGLRVVAEGVEDERVLRALHDAGCHVAQGWLHARPMPPGELIGWLDRYRPAPPTPAPVSWPVLIADARV
jgi:diguanylate cyclase (GGDEF)-like protein